MKEEARRVVSFLKEVSGMKPEKQENKQHNVSWHVDMFPFSCPHPIPEKYLGYHLLLTEI